MSAGAKICKKCGDEQRTNRCTRCNRAYHQAYRERNKERLAAQRKAYALTYPEVAKAWASANRERLRAYKKAHRAAWVKPYDPAKRKAEYERNRKQHMARNKVYRERNRQYYREWAWKQQGIALTWPEYLQREQTQNGCCANDGCRVNPGMHKLVVDHDHGSGRVRGLLCAKCNALAGLGKDSPSLLSGLAVYLKRHHAHG